VLVALLRSSIRSLVRQAGTCLQSEARLERQCCQRDQSYSRKQNQQFASMQVEA